MPIKPIDFSILNWNIGGAKFLEEKKERRGGRKDRLNKGLKNIITQKNPDIVTLQEVVHYGHYPDVESIINKKEFSEYNYYFFPLIDTCRLSSKDKWDKVKKIKIKNENGEEIEVDNWPEDTYFAQGNAFLIKNELPHFPVLDLTADHTNPSIINESNSNVSENDKKIRDKKLYYIEQVNFESGLYFGNRDTERRAALVVHFIVNPDKANPKKPLDIFIINTHLTTLTMEREGIPQIDLEATETYRLPQLDIIFRGIISRYNEWKQRGFPNRGEKRDFKENKKITDDRFEPVWIIAGDLNFTPESTEYEYIKKMNFIDVMNPPQSNKYRFTKAPSFQTHPTITVDYIFAGPKFISLDEYLARPKTHTHIYDYEDNDVKGVSDHFPMYAGFKGIIPMERKK